MRCFFDSCSQASLPLDVKLILTVPVVGINDTLFPKPIAFTWFQMSLKV